MESVWHNYFETLESLLGQLPGEVLKGNLWFISINSSSYFSSDYSSLTLQLKLGSPAHVPETVCMQFIGAGGGNKDPVSILAWRIPWNCKESDMTERLSLSADIRDLDDCCFYSRKCRHRVIVASPLISPGFSAFSWSDFQSM